MRVFPRGGYTAMIANMLDGAEIRLNVDYLENREELDAEAEKVVFTGQIDEFFEFRYGPLEYRTLEFQHEVVDGDYQGNAIINYTQAEVPWTRITEHKHFEFLKSDKSIITKEFSRAYEAGKKQTPYYPVDNAKNRAVYEKYRHDWQGLPNMVGGGRLFSFKYYDMDQVIGSAMTLAKKEIKP
jgi:UDP-galactopyranose mutase